MVASPQRKKRGLTKAAISKQISSLEEACGLRLLNRTTRSIELTDAGAQIFQESQSIRESLKGIQNFLSGYKKIPQGHLKVFSGRHFAERYIIPYLKEWTDRYPKVTLELDLSERIPDLEKEGLDVMVGLSIPGPPNAIQKKIGTTRYVLCAAPSYLESFGKPKKVADLKSHRYLAHTMRQPNYSIQLNGKEVVLNPFLYVNDAQALKDLAVEGIGMTWIHEYLATKKLKSGALVEILPELSAKRDVPLYVCYREAKLTPPKVRAFINFVQNCSSGPR